MADDPNEPPGAFVGMRADVAGQGYEVGDRIRVRGYGYGRWAPRSTVRDRRAWVAHVGGKGPPESLMPRWRRGELRHAEQRRKRAERQIASAARQVVDNLRPEIRQAFDRARVGIPTAFVLEIDDDVGGP